MAAAPQAYPSPDRRRILTARTVIGFLVYSLMTPVILFLAAGTLDWPMGWLYAIITLGVGVASRVLLFTRQPDLAAERGKFTNAEGAKQWDRVLVPLVALVLPLVVLIVCGLDYRLNGPGRVALGVQLAATILMVAGYALGIWALLTNRFFSTVVRIQTERGHTVVSNGPYRYVRHPGYAGGLVYYLATPLVLGAPWGCAPAGVLAVLLVLRTALEDNTLRQELPGYAEYAARVRYRLIPAIW
jgi:protein-S-isoprenylcysteine O-methyltransferase Ste14